MSKFDWSKVTAAQLRDVPQAVVGDYFEIDTDDRPFYLMYQDVTVAELCSPWSRNSEWIFSESAGERYARGESIVRSTIACIDRIANYLQMQGAT